VDEDARHRRECGLEVPEQGRKTEQTQGATANDDSKNTCTEDILSHQKCSYLLFDQSSAFVSLRSMFLQDE